MIIRENKELFETNYQLFRGKSFEVRVLLKPVISVKKQVEKDQYRSGLNLCKEPVCSFDSNLQYNDDVK